MGNQVLYAENLPEIPSEYIERYAQRFMMMQLEAIAYGLISSEEAKQTLKGVGYFLECFSGIHAQIAVSNEYSRIIYMEEDTLIKIAKKTFNIPY